ncbi:hypothetical protein ACRU3B_10615 [Mycobacterium colombiense]
MTNVDDFTDLQDFRRSIFGQYSVNEVMPQAYLSQLRRLADGADVILGIRHGDKARTALWLKGGVLGHLACTGTRDDDAEIKGWILRLAEVAQIDIEVQAVPGTWDDSPWDSGRILKIDGNTLLDASPAGGALRDKRAEIEQFIDRVLDTFAGKAR